MLMSWSVHRCWVTAATCKCIYVHHAGIQYHDACICSIDSPHFCCGWLVNMVGYCNCEHIDDDNSSSSYLQSMSSAVCVVLDLLVLAGDIKPCQRT